MYFRAIDVFGFGSLAIRLLYVIVVYARGEGATLETSMLSLLLLTDSIGTTIFKISIGDLFVGYNEPILEPKQALLF